LKCWFERPIPLPLRLRRDVLPPIFF
jgi:hypothetical protein